MKLPRDFKKLYSMELSRDILIKAILERRTVIRYARDQVGDDRCWLDYFPIYEMLEGYKPPFDRLPSFEESMEICTSFFEKRQEKENGSDFSDKLERQNRQDNQLREIGDDKLLAYLHAIQQAIFTHSNIPIRDLTIDHDKYLYSVLTDGICGNYQLPPREEFLGEAKSPCAGCPSFLRSHSNRPPLPWGLQKWGSMTARV